MRYIRAVCLSLLVIVGLPACGQNEATTAPTLPFGKSPTILLEVRQGEEEVLRLIAFFCGNVYPRPTEAECIDRVKHAIGASADPHSKYFNAAEVKKFREDTSGQFGGIGIEIFKGKNAPVLVLNVIEGTPAARAGVLAGDFITHIIPEHGVPVPTIPFESADDAVKLLRGEPRTSVRIRVTRKNVESSIEFTLAREVIRTVRVESNLIVYEGKTYAYIKAKQFQEKLAFEVGQHFALLKKRAGGELAGLILNMENNPGGLLDEAYNLIRLFDESPGDIILTRDNEGIESYIPPPHRVLHPTPRSITNGLPILVVVNGVSASASEVVATALRHRGLGVVAGTGNTFGKGVVQTIVPTSDGGAIKFTSSEYLIGSKSDWVPVQCTGVGLDIQFAYSGIKPRESLSECTLSGHVNTGGPMINGPVKRPVQEANPVLYQKALVMLEAYMQYALPKLQKEEELRKKLEQEK